MSDWATFAVATVALTLLLLYLTRRSRQTLERARIVDSRSDLVAVSDDPDASGGLVDGDDPDSDTGVGVPVPDDRPILTTPLLLVNAALSQALGLVALVAIAWWTAVPPSAFGVGGAHPTLGWPALATAGTPSLVGVGVAAGVALAAGNEGVARLGARVGIAPSARLREAMTPGGPGGWALLFGVVLPIVAVFEEALFRGAIVGALALGLTVDPWLLAVGSSVAFGLGHGAQGRFGVVVAGALGLALAGLFVVTGSLIAPIVAHYVVNASEFVVREGVGGG